MTALVAATALLSVVALLNLVLTVGVIKRLREHTELLQRHHGGSAGPDGPAALPSGSVVPSFSTTTVDGDTVSLDDLTEGTLVAFMSTSCSTCTDELPSLVDAAARRPGGRDGVLVVVVSDSDSAAEMVDALRPHARVVIEPYGGAASNAFDLMAFPTFVTMGARGVVGGVEMTAPRLPIVV